MARPGFYNDNLGRSFPFVVVPGSSLPTYAVCDFGCTMYAGSGFIPGTHSVMLTTISRSGSTFSFEFTSDAPGLSGLSLVFTRDVTDSRYATDYAEPSTESSVCDEHLRWLGYLVTGDMTALAALVADGASLVGSFVVEPSQIRSADGCYARSINVANADRTRAEPTADCRSFCWPFTLSDFYTVGECLTGSVVFKEGYNARVGLDTGDNAITIDASVGAGAGEPYELVKVTDDEGPPAGLSLLDGSLACCDVVRSINGVGSRYFRISGQGGVIVTPVPAEHKVVVDVRMFSMANCPELPAESSLTIDDPSADPCDCGPA